MYIPQTEFLFSGSFMWHACLSGDCGYRRDDVATTVYNVCSSSQLEYYILTTCVYYYVVLYLHNQKSEKLIHL